MKRLVSALISLVMIFSVFGVFPQMAGAASMTDKDFFAKLDLSLPALSSVKDAIEAEDYTEAKKALLTYFKERAKASGSEAVTEADENYGMAVLPMRNILTGPYEFDMWQAEFPVTSTEYSTYTIDVTERVAHELDNKVVSFMLFAGDKQSAPVYVKSKESGDGAPQLKITYSANRKENSIVVSADNDTYVSSKDKDKTFGDADELVIIEDPEGSNAAVGNDTRRAYINFPIDEAANSDIISASLILTAKCEKNPSDVLIINVGDTTWSEDTLKWSGISGSIYSYENLDDPKWDVQGIPNVDNEYHNVTSRFWFGKPMAYEYLSYLKNSEEYKKSHPYAETYPGEDFGPKLVDLMSAFASQMNYGYKRTLETGERLNRWVDILDAFLQTDVFDGREDDFVKILSFMWGDCNYLEGLSISDNSVWWSNWKLVANAGLFKAVEFLPEFKLHDAWRTRVESNVEYVIDTLYNGDMSFTEAGPSYAEWCMKLFGDCAVAADNAGNPMSSTFITKLRYLARNAAQSFFPDGYDSNVGDSNYRDKMPDFKFIAEYLDDPMLNAYVNGDENYDGELSVLYNDSNSAYMRTSWDPDETTYVSFVNNPSDGHYHPDSNQVLMYAYGQPLLVDSGRYGYDSSTNDIYDELRWSQAHNTIEAEGVSMGTHANSAQKFSVWADNDDFTFATSSQVGYPNTTHTRNVLFLKKSGITLVSDYVDGTNATQSYRQNWHFMPSNNAEVQEDNHTISTDFYNRANVDLYNADSDATAEIKSGYFSADYGLVANSEYASFQKTGEDVKFSTLIRPRRAGVEYAPIKVSDTSDSLSSAAVAISRNSEESPVAYFYIKNKDDADGKFGSYTTDAKMALLSLTDWALVNGKSLKDGEKEIIASPFEINSISVKDESGFLDSEHAYAITGEGLAPVTDKDKAVKIYAPNAVKVTYNGEDVPFEQDGDYIYAVGFASVTTVETVGEIKASKDGFVKQDGTNEGTSNPNFIQAAVSGWAARNAYTGFDLSKYADSDFTKATLRLTMVAENNDDTAAAGTLHFYFLNYGNWERGTAKFVEDDSKMPTRENSNSTAPFTGYPFHFTADGGSVTSQGAQLEVDFTSQLKEYLAGIADKNIAPGEPKFTLAILSESGSRKFASINNPSYEGPTIILTKETTEGAVKETSVTVNFVNDKDETIAEPQTITENLTPGKLYTYDLAPSLIEHNDVTYVLDSKSSNLGVMLVEGENHVLTARYIPAAKVNINFIYKDETVSSEAEYVIPGATYTFTPDMFYIFDEQAYLTDTERSGLSVKTSADGDNTIEVLLVKATISENKITNGDFKDGTKDWTDAATGAQFGGALSDDDEYVHGDGSALTNVESKGGSEVTTLRRFVEVTPGKTYYLSFYAYNTGAAMGSGNNGCMSAFVPVKGKVFGSFNNLVFKDYVAYGGQNSWSNESQSEVKRDRNDMPYESGMNHKEYMITVPEDADNIMISMFAWTAPERLYFSDFTLYEIESEIVPATVTVRYISETGEEVLPPKTFSARVGDAYDVTKYIIKDAIHSNKKIYTYNADATKNLTGTVDTDTVIDIIYSAEEYDGVLLSLSFDDEEQGFKGGLGKADAKGDIVLADGVSGQALKLDGTGSDWLNATLSDGSSLLANVPEITISYYSRISSTEKTNWPFFAANSANSQTYQSERYIGAMDKDDSLTVERYNNGGTRDTSNNVTAAAPKGEWRLVTVVLKKDKTEVYVNGALVSEAEAKNTLSDVLGSSPVLQIGKANWGSGEYYSGLIDEFKVFDHALTAEEVAALYGNSFTFDGEKASVKSNDGGVIVIAQYNADGTVVKVETKAVKAGEETELALTKAEGAVTAKAFLWNTLSGMKPIVSSITAPVK